MTKAPLLEIPLAPLILKGEDEPIITERLRPYKTLNLKELVDEISLSSLFTEEIQGKPWSVISTVSPYSLDFHVMLMELSKDRYLPSLEYVFDSEGDDLMNLWVRIIKYMKKTRKNQRIVLGYNWSPRSWGELEEKGGFQSIPTKWHGMFVTWPKSNKNFNFVDKSFNFKRFNGENDFLCDIVKDWNLGISDIKNNHSSTCISNGEMIKSTDGFIMNFNCSLDELFEINGFFSKFLKPLASYLNEYFKDLSDIFIDSPSWSDEIDNILKKISSNPLSSEDYKFIQDLSSLKTDEEIIYLLENKGFSKKAIIELMELVKNRYNLSHSNGWRKGFAYALTFEEINNNLSELKIVPGAYLGLGGVVESKGYMFKRPEDYNLSNEELKKRSNDLYKLASYLDSSN